MARSHWRFIARDAYGYVLQNAHVNVYLPGTTTVFSGSAFDAVSGGSAVTNPFTTNAQGEVEAWFVTPQSVDVAVDDNSSAAYRAVDGAGGAFSFTAFTEKDEIHMTPEDDKADADEAILQPGVSGDILDIDPGDATVAGATGKYADAGHQHENTGLPNAHGPASHSNVVRSFFLKAEDATLGTGAAFLNVGAGLNLERTVEYSDAASEDAFWTFALPTDFNGSVITVRPVWSPAATDGVAHTVRWVYTAKELASGTNVTAAGTTTTWTGASAARTVDILVYDTNTSTGVTPAAGDTLFQLNVQRLGADGADTYVGAVRLHGLIVTYTADQ